MLMSTLKSMLTELKKDNTLRAAHFIEKGTISTAQDFTAKKKLLFTCCHKGWNISNVSVDKDGTEVGIWIKEHDGFKLSDVSKYCADNKEDFKNWNWDVSSL